MLCLGKEIGKTQYQQSWEKGREKWLHPPKNKKHVASCLACGIKFKIDGSGIKLVEAHEVTKKHEKHLQSFLSQRTFTTGAGSSSSMGHEKYSLTPGESV